MAVKIRLARRGRKNMPIYSIVVADARASRDGRFIKKVGTYNPHTHPATVQIEEETTLFYLQNGAQPTDTVRNILSKAGILLKKHLQLGVQKGAITQEVADKKFAAWKAEKEAKEGKKETTQAAPATDKKVETPAKPTPKKEAEEAEKPADKEKGKETETIAKEEVTAAADTEEKKA